MQVIEKMERETGLEPATSSLVSWKPIVNRPTAAQAASLPHMTPASTFMSRTRRAANVGAL